MTDSLWLLVFSPLFTSIDFCYIDHRLLLINPIAINSNDHKAHKIIYSRGDSQWSLAFFPCFFIPQFKTKWISSRPGVTPAQFYEDVVLKLTEVVRSVRVDVLNPINGTNIYNVRKSTFSISYQFPINKLNVWRWTLRWRCAEGHSSKSALTTTTGTVSPWLCLNVWQRMGSW